MRPGWASPLAVILAVLVISGEYSSGMIRTALLRQGSC
jgi:hypothetical protein